MPSLKKNIFYSTLLTLANYIFPLITYPYVSRVLGVTNIGICNFVDNIINYFLVFSTMGISVLGVREIAAVRDNRKERDKAFSSLLALNAATTFVAAVVLAVAIFVVPSLVPYRKLLFVGVAKLIANSLFLEWLFRGIEDFQYITNRSIIIKTLYVVAVFVFVRKPEDYDIYYLLLALTVILNALVNAVHSRRFVSFSLKDIKLGDFVKPYFLLGLNYILSAVYTSFNVIYLGFVQDAEQVGYYTSATKILSMITALFSACTTVLLPRMSAVLSEGKVEDFRRYVVNTIEILFLIGIPAVFLLQAEAMDIIRLISGAGYEGAILPMKIVAPMILISGLDQILIVQILMPLKKDVRILINSAVGASVGIILNLLLIHSLGARGSAIVWICAELSVCIAALTAVFSNKSLTMPVKNVLGMVLLYLPLLLILYGISTLQEMSFYLRLLLSGGVTGLFFIAVACWILKNPLVLEFFGQLLRWRKKNG